MTDVLTSGRPAERLASEQIGWLTTAGADGQPASSPIWFHWDGAAVWLRSRDAGRVPNVRANPKVALHLADDGYGGDIVTLEGTAAVVDEWPAEVREAYLAKYGEPIRAALATTPEQLEVDYPVILRIEPTRARAW